MINLLFAGNTGVRDGILISSVSALMRSDLSDEVCIYILTADLTELDPRYTEITANDGLNLENALKRIYEGVRVKVIDVKDLYNDYFAGCPNEDAYCSPYTLFRLFCDLLPLPDKILYLDADTIFNRDVQLLYAQDIKDFEYAAARDSYGKFLVSPNYINAGVLLFNLAKTRETGLLEKSRNLIRKRKLVFADQSALIRSTTKKKMLNKKYNDQRHLRKDTVIRHFSKRLFWLPYPHTENIKQWQIDKIHKVFGYTQFDDIFEEYKNIKEKKVI